MLKKSYRLNLRTKPVLASSFSSPFFTLRFGKNISSSNHFAIIVSKRIDKRAVVRNKVKRVFINCIQNFLDSFKPGYDMVFILKEEILTTPSQLLCAHTKQILSKKGLLQ